MVARFVISGIRGVLFGAAIVAAFLAFVLEMGKLAYGDSKPFVHRAESTVGATEAEVGKRMGRPQRTIRKEDLLGASLAESRYETHYRPIPTRPITHKVLIYQTPMTCAYVFIGPNGRVEAVETAGT